MASKKYDEAIKLYQSLFNYKDSKEKRQEAIYQQALVYISNQKYSEAIAKLTMIEGYNDDVAAQLNVAKYGYIKANYDVKNPTTVSYLSELAKINYKDSAALYDDLCVWTIDIVANSSSTGTENLTSISKYKRFYFKITAWGKFGESLDTKIQLIYTNGLTKDYTANFTYNKTASIDYFEPYMSPGLATVNVYKADTNELLKTHSVELLP